MLGRRVPPHHPAPGNCPLLGVTSPWATGGHLVFAREHLCVCACCMHTHTHTQNEGTAVLTGTRRHVHLGPQALPGDRGPLGWWGCCVWRTGDRQRIEGGFWVALALPRCQVGWRVSPFPAFSEDKMARRRHLTAWGQNCQRTCSGEATVSSCASCSA